MENKGKDDTKCNVLFKQKESKTEDRIAAATSINIILIINN